jgi:hypothetical protein
MQLGRAYVLQSKFKEALRVYSDAMEFNPEDSEVHYRIEATCIAGVTLTNAVAHDGGIVAPAYGEQSESI